MQAFGETFSERPSQDVRAYSLALIGLIESGKLRTRYSLNEAKIRLCREFGLHEMPTNATILSFAEKRSERLVSLLKVKPTRSLSGISVVAIMPKPGKCPGQCVYCPGSLVPERDTPKSYTGLEPATMRALAMGFSAKRQVENRLAQLEEAGHSTGKVELIVMGGTFLAHSKSYQNRFMLSSINALNGSGSRSLKAAKKRAQSARRRITGITFETRPDYCGKSEVDRMLSFGGTRCELGVQTIYDRVYRLVRRGHLVKDVVDATAILKDSAFKVSYHYMPGLPSVSLSEDKRALRSLFSEPGFRPDNLKVYPCLVIRGTKLFRQWKKGLYTEFSTEKAVRLLSYAKQFLPRWVRVMRIQRDIPAQLISAGVKKSNLRQIVQEELRLRERECNCIRCREAGLSSFGKSGSGQWGEPMLFIEGYEASNGFETFVSLEDKARKALFGFARLRFPSQPFRKELSGKTALLRELRVFGLPLPLHQRKEREFQHRGFGKALLQECESISSANGMKKLVVISGLGVKPYYFAQGFKEEGPFVSKPVE